MDEKDIDKLIQNQDIPPASAKAKDAAKSDAWEALQSAKKKAFKPILTSRGSALRAASIIAVMLFATLSYAVTQSTRSGGGDATSETNLVNSAQLTQYPAGIRTSIVRMMISGKRAENLRFNTPDQFATLNTPEIGVFHPDGGGAIYQLAPAGIMADGQEGQWHFNMEFIIEIIGTDENEMVAFLPGIMDKTCERINEELGITGLPQSNIDLSSYYDADMTDDGVKDYQIPPKEKAQKLPEGLEGQPYGCFQNSNGEFVYYHVLLEN